MITKSDSLEKANEWAAQLWSEMISYGEVDSSEFINQLANHFTEEVLGEIKDLYFPNERLCNCGSGDSWVNCNVNSNYCG